MKNGFSAISLRTINYTNSAGTDLPFFFYQMHYDHLKHMNFTDAHSYPGKIHQSNNASLSSADAVHDDRLCQLRIEDEVSLKNITKKLSYTKYFLFRRFNAGTSTLAGDHFRDVRLQYTACLQKKRNDLCKRDRCLRYVLQSCFAMRFKEKARPVQKGSFLSKGLIHEADVFLHQRDRLRRTVA